MILLRTPVAVALVVGVVRCVAARPHPLSVPGAAAQTPGRPIAGLRRRGVPVDALLERLGVPAARLEQWLAGREPAPWIQREIAAALGVERHELWPDEGDP